MIDDENFHDIMKDSDDDLDLLEYWYDIHNDPELCSELRAKLDCMLYKQDRELHDFIHKGRMN